MEKNLSLSLSLSINIYVCVCVHFFYFSIKHIQTFYKELVNLHLIQIKFLRQPVETASQLKFYTQCCTFTALSVRLMLLTVLIIKSAFFLTLSYCASFEVVFAAVILQQATCRALKIDLLAEIQIFPLHGTHVLPGWVG